MHSEYDNAAFFAAYAQMPRSRGGLEAAGEWRQLKALLPDMTGKAVLDLGCGYGWHCRYAAQMGARRVLGIDLSRLMLDEAIRRTEDERIAYRHGSLEDYEYPADAWDVVVSNLAMHYAADIGGIFRRIYDTIKPGGVFVMNIEHPVFTAGVGQDWVYGLDGKPLYWPVDDYFHPGERVTNFLGHEVRKQHHTLTDILMGLRRAGFILDAVEEAMPLAEMMHLPGMANEMRRPMMLLIRAVK